MSDPASLYGRLSETDTPGHESRGYFHLMSMSFFSPASSQASTLPPPEASDAEAVLRRQRYAASQLRELRTEALVQQALAAQGIEAAQWLSVLCSQDASNGDWPALLLRTLRQSGQFDSAHIAAKHALRRFPLHAGLRLQYWDLCESLSADERLRILRQWLPHVSSGAELKALLGLLPTASGNKGAEYWGVVEYHAPSNSLHGWAVNLAKPGESVGLEIDTGQGVGRIRAEHPHTLLAEAGISLESGGFRVRLPGPIPRLTVRFEHGPELLGSPLAATDGVRAGYTGFGADSPIPQGEPWQLGVDPRVAGACPPPEPVDVLIPVYKGFQATLDCVQSVLKTQALNTTQHNIVVLDDASPDPQLASALQSLARESRIQYVRQEANLGFIRNMNRGMALHTKRDVVWLNADTRVHGDWLDRLQRAAYLQANTASATPFSNNGELMSFPEPRVAGPMPDETGLAQLDTLAAQLDAPPLPLPMGCGFCFYIKRAALDHVGLLDEVHLRRGYGEESDWCLRARQGGWQHIGVPNVYVAHSGGASFGSEKALRVAQNNAVLRARFPYAEKDYQAFLARDPLAGVRAFFEQALAHAGRDTAGNVLAASSTGKKADLRLARRPKLKTPGSAWLILDSHPTPRQGAQWLAIARSLARKGLMDGAPTPRLLTLEHTLWQPQWQATGWVYKLPELLDLDLKQRLALWGAGAAVSLSAQPGPELLQAAKACGLPVYAADTPEWRAAGAWALPSLPGFPEEVEAAMLDIEKMNS